MSGRIATREMPLLAQHRMPDDLKRAFIEAKQRIAHFGAVASDTFDNKDDGFGGGPPLPVLSHGCRYIKFDVGMDRLGRRGERRLVFEIHETSWRILTAFFSDAHYLKGTFQLIRMP